MKRFQRILLTSLVFVSVNIVNVWAESGIPFFKNYFPSVYQAHNRNFDLVADDKGRLFVANFEALLYYDQSDWHTIHAPGIFRFTKLYKDQIGRIWFGGYNIFGYLTTKGNGRLDLKYIFSQNSKGFLGEVTDIWEENGKMCVETSIGQVGLEDNSMEGFVIRKKMDEHVETYNDVLINQKLVLPDQSVLLATAGAGFLKLDSHGNIVFSLSERNGLCNNNVNAIYIDSLGYVWGATDEGVFLVNINSAYTHFGASEGLEGEVQSICKTTDRLYVGTLRGLFFQDGKRFRRINPINHACWQIQASNEGGVYASTANGLFVVKGNKVHQLSTNHTLSFHTLPNGDFYAGELDGVYHYHKGKRRQVNTIEKVTCFIMEGDSILWMRNLYGQIFRSRIGEHTFNLISITSPEDDNKTEEYNNSLFTQNGKIFIVSHLGLFVWKEQSMVPVDRKSITNNKKIRNEYPQFFYPEHKRIWITNRVGKSLAVFSDSEDDIVLNEAVVPLESYVIQSMDSHGDDYWMGGSFGLIHWDSSSKDPDFRADIDLYIRRVVINNDSVVWGGFNDPATLSHKLSKPKLAFQDNINKVRVEFSSNAISTLGDIKYRYRLDTKKNWSEWSTETYATFANPRSGAYKFEVMARDRYGRVTEPLSFDVNVKYPFYLRWYSWVGYTMLLSLLILVLIRWRMRRLLHEKQRLEQLVENRTSQIIQQKDEIEEKSRNLERALDDLNRAQFELIRKEKMATVGTLTQGLVDRILNPMNYVNNFSHMSIGLVEDMKQNVDDDKDRMTPDIYDDSLDLLDMLTTNLTKIEEHGLNTTRILKAMEEMLKERTGNMIKTDIAALCRKNIEMLNSYRGKDIEAAHIDLEAPDKDLKVLAVVDAEQLSKTIMSMLTNSVYAINKKVGKMVFDPIIRLNVSLDGKTVYIKAYDNGIGIESSIVDKIFDPFFTTKTTAEAVGVGLYISREVIRNHGGDITVKSEKNNYTEFQITLPINQEK